MCVFFIYGVFLIMGYPKRYTIYVYNLSLGQ